MAHPDTVSEAVDVPAPESDAAAIDAFDNIYGDGEEEQPDAEEEAETEDCEEVDPTEPEGEAETPRWLRKKNRRR